jgi:DUF1680 family protein
VATHNDTGIQIHQYIPATINTPLGSLTMTTQYPLDGIVDLTVTASTDHPWTLALRIPGWCKGSTVTVNGSPAGELTRQWHPGDQITLTLPMPPRLTTLHPSVDATRGTVAIERGPLVYCLESPDQPSGVDLNHLELSTTDPLTEEFVPDFLGQPTVLVHAQGIARDDTPWTTPWATIGEEPPPATRLVPLTAIPYHLWANRGPSTMRIFIPRH